MTVSGETLYKIMDLIYADGMYLSAPEIEDRRQLLRELIDADQPIPKSDFGANLIEAGDYAARLFGEE